MKMKSFAVLAMSGFLAAYVAPALADDASNIDQAAASDNNPPMVQADNSSSLGNDNTDANGSANSVDQGSPDTATGDDDY